MGHGPPPYLATRRARARARKLRRRQTALTVLLAALVGAIAVVVISGGGSSPSAATRATSAPSRTQLRGATPAPARGGPHHLSASPRAAATIRRLLRLGLPIYCGGPRGNAVAFTFDDGPGVYTNLALKKLTQAHEQATFFDVGRSMNAWPGYLPRELRVAAIEDHTYTHPELTALPPSQVTWQLLTTQRMIEAQSGERVDMFRPPYELHNPVVDGIARRLGLLEILWDVDSRDSLGANWTQITANVEAGLRPGAIIEMHENHGQTIRALTTLLPELRRRHLRSVSVPELLAIDPPSPAQVRAGPYGCGAGKHAPGSAE